jgi:hypothetical protein
MNVHNKLECLSLEGLKWVRSGACPKVEHWNGCFIWVGSSLTRKHACRGKHSSLLGTLLNYGRKILIALSACVNIKTLYGRNLRMLLIS